MQCSDLTEVLAAPYRATASAKDAPRPFSVIYTSGAAHGRWKLVGRYMSIDTAEDVADALNHQRFAVNRILGDF